MTSKDWTNLIAEMMQLVRDFAEQLLEQLFTPERVLFRFTEFHSKARLAVAFLLTSAVVAPVFYQYFGWAIHAGLVGAFVAVFLISAVIVSGLRTSIVVTPTRTTITHMWLLIPYQRWSARAMDDVSYGGDWGKSHYAAGVVVQLGNKEVHIGSGKTMHALYEALLPLSKGAGSNI